MKRLIMDLLDYSRVGSNTEPNENVDLHLLVEEIKDLFGKSIDEVKANITVDRLPIVKGNRTQLLQLFQNLISNAIKYHKEGVPTIEIHYTEQEEDHLFEIKDNGIGIDPAFHEKIFVIFHRLHSRSEYTGTGIGLAICKKIVERHNGKIWVKSALGQGSSFFFTLGKR
jgi:two-component system CheB/CheR fusion protein